MKLITGDIVEILNLSKKQIEDIESQTCTNSLNTKQIIGMRYKISILIFFSKTENNIELIGWNHGGHISMLFNESQLKLYHRPFINKLIARLQFLKILK